MGKSRRKCRDEYKEPHRLKECKHRQAGCNEHHILGQCNRGRAKVQEETNKKLVNILDHQALNTIVGTNQHPQAQLEVMNDKFGWDKVMSQFAQDLLHVLIEMEREEFYKQSLLLKR